MIVGVSYIICGLLVKFGISGNGLIFGGACALVYVGLLGRKTERDG